MNAQETAPDATNDSLLALDNDAGVSKMMVDYGA